MAKEIITTMNLKDVLNILRKHHLQDEVLVDSNKLYVMDNKSVRVLSCYIDDLRIK